MCDNKNKNQQYMAQGAGDPMINQKQAESQIRLNEDFIKKNNELQFLDEKNKRQLYHEYDLLEVKARHQEREEEERLARYEEVKMGSDGSLCIVTKSRTLEASPRPIVNFRLVEVISYINADNSEEMIWYISIVVQKRVNKEEHIFLDPEKCDKSGYIQKKFLAVGGSFWVKSEAKKKEYCKMVVEFMIQFSTKTIQVPEKRGWYVVDGNMQFFDGLWTWEELVRNAK